MSTGTRSPAHASVASWRLQSPSSAVAVGGRVRPYPMRAQLPALGTGAAATNNGPCLQRKDSRSLGPALLAAFLLLAAACGGAVLAGSNDASADAGTSAPVSFDAMGAPDRFGVDGAMPNSPTGSSAGSP